MAVEERLDGEFLFKFQFFVHESILTKDFFNIARPAIALRFLDFPTLIIDGNLLSNQIHSSFRLNSKEWSFEVWTRQEMQLQNAQ